MKMRSKLLLVMLPLFIVTYIGHTILTYNTVRNETIQDLHKEAEDVRAILMATRRVYHLTFLDSGLPLTDQTLPFLPAHALSRISEDFSSWTSSEMSFNNVSDRPRNPSNTADIFEMAALDYFRQNPKEKERFVEITTLDGKHMYHYTRPIWTEEYCMKCHGDQEVAPDSIRKRYSTAYDYTPGDLRGLMSIKLPTEAAHARMMGSLGNLLPLTLVQYAIAFALIYSLLIRRATRRLRSLEANSEALAAGEYDRIDPLDGDDEIAQVARRFSEMASRIQLREGILSKREERKDLALHGAGLGTWDWNVPTGEVAFSDRWAEMLGYDASELEPNETTWRNLVHPDDLPGVMRILTAHLNNETERYEVEHRLRHRSGQWVWVLARGRVIERNEQGQPLRACGTHMDITTKKLIEQVMFESEARFHAIFENIGSGIAIYEAVDEGEDFVFKDINPEGAKIGNIPRERHLGKRVTEVYPGVADLGLLNVLREVYRSGKPCHYPLSAYKDERITLWVHNYVCKLPSGEVVAMYDDLTEQKRAESALEEKLVALTQPLEDTEGISFTDLFNIEDIQRLQDEFAEATGVASLIEDTQGNALTKPSNFCHLCNDIIRQTEKGKINCCKSDVAIGRYNPEGPIVQPCLSGGLWDAGAAITIGGRHIASWFVGQVRNEAQSEEKMRAYAREIETDEDDFIQAYRDVPAMSQERFNKIAQVLYTLSNQLSNIAYQNVQQARFITERKQAEDALRESQEKLAETNQLLTGILEHTHMMAVFLDTEFNFIWVNRAYAKTCQHEPSFFQGKNHFELYPHKENQEIFQRVVNEGKTFAVEAKPFVFPDQPERGLSYWDWSLVPVKNEEGQVTGLVFTLAEVTERIRHETEIQQNEQYLRTILETTVDGFWVTKASGEILEVNDAYCVMSGYERSELLNLCVYDLEAAESPESAYHHIQRIIANGSERFETLHRRKDGSLFPLEVSVTFLKERDGQLVCFFRDLTERKKAENAIRESEARFHAFMDHNPALAWAKDEHGRYVYLNRTYEERFNLKQEDWHGKTDMEIWPPFIAEIFQRNDRTVLTEQKAIEVEEETRSEDGGCRIWQTMKFPFKDGADERFVGGFAVDVTERKHAEEELRRSEERLALALDVSGAGVWRWNIQTDEFQIDDKFLNMLGYDRNEIPTNKKEWQKLHHPDDMEHMRAHHQEHLQGDAPFYESEHRMLHKTGEWLWVYTRGRTITRDESGQPEWCIGVVIDITDRKQAEEQLRSSEERYRNFVAHASEGIYRVDFTTPIRENLPDEEIVKLASERAIVAEVNDALANMYELTPEEMIGKPATNFSPDYGDRTLWAIRAPQKQVQNVETLDKTKDGSDLHLAESYSAVIEDGLVVRIWGMQRNITERKRAEEAIRHAQAMLMEQQRTEKERVEKELAKAQRKLVTQTRLATIGQVAGSIAHELRNPLGAVRNAAFFLKRYAPNGQPTTLKHLKIIEDEVTTANQIITDLMGVIRAEKPSKHPVKLDELTREVLDRVNIPPGIECQVALPNTPAEILADAAQLRQVLVNILTNAVQALNESGIIRISATEEDACDIITIEDNGPGIQGEDLEQVFEPLFTTKAKGTGLGLTICREMVERHGGKLDVTKAELGGAAFSIRLPK